jgi:hypothetical protein
MVPKSGRLLFQVAPIVFAIVAALAVSARDAAAQGVGFQGGVTIDPEQIYGGSHFETRPLIDRLHLRLGVDGGFGDDRRLALINFDLIYKFPLDGGTWTLYQGSGPAIIVERFGDRTDVRGGLAVVFGIAHARGFFTEFKVAALNAPNLKFGVGYTIK